VGIAASPYFLHAHYRIHSLLS
jgi:DNA replication licensing factor MCM2